MLQYGCENTGGSESKATFGLQHSNADLVR